MSLGQQITKNSGIQIMGRFLSVLLSAVLFRIISRYLGVSGVGEYNTAFVYIQMFGAVGDLGLYLYLVREMTTDRRQTEELLSNALGFRLLLTAVIALVAVAIVTVVPTTTYSLATKFGIVLGAAIAGVALLFQTISAYFQQRFRAELIVIPETLGKAVTLAATWWAVASGQSLQTIFWAAFVGGIASFLISWLIIRQFLPIRFRFNSDLWRKHWAGLWPMALLAGFALAHSRIDSVILSLMRGSRSVEMGLYGGAYRMFDLVLVIPGILAGNIIPVLAARWRKPDATLGRALTATSMLSLIGGVATASLVYLFAPYILLILAGPQFLAATLTLRILALVLLVLFLSQHMTNIIIATDMTRRAIRPLIIVTVLNAALNVLLIPLAPLIVPALLTGLTEGVLLVWKWRLLPEKAKPRLPLAQVLAILAAAILPLLLVIRPFDRSVSWFAGSSFKWQLLIGLGGAGLWLMLLLFLFFAIGVMDRQNLGFGRHD